MGFAHTLPSRANMFTRVSALTTNTTLDTSHHFAAVTTGGSTITITLPASANNKGRIYRIAKVDSGAGKVTVDGDDSETINGLTTIDLDDQWDSLSIISDGANWVAESAVVVSSLSAPDGGPSDALTVDNDGNITINDSQNDIDFRVESDNQEYMLHVDGGNDRVAILGDGTPTQTFEINGSLALNTVLYTGSSHTVSATDCIILNNSSSAPSTMALPAASSHKGRVLILSSIHATGSLAVSRAGSDTIEIDSNNRGQTLMAVGPGMSKILISDGVSKWVVVGDVA